MTEDFAGRIDHTLLDKDAPESAYDELVETANEFGMNVCVPPSYVERVARDLREDREVVAVVGFPHGTTTTDAKAYEARGCVDRGATELDVACNVSALKSGNEAMFVEDLRGVVEAGVKTKAIIETGLLNDEEKRRAARLCVEAGADYVKTCTGFARGNATAEDVHLLKEAVGNDALVKASGGISDGETALSMLEAGASRIGASSGDKIVRDYS